jgi:hypothetical protein
MLSALGPLYPSPALPASAALKLSSLDSLLLSMDGGSAGKKSGRVAKMLGSLQDLLVPLPDAKRVEYLRHVFGLFFLGDAASPSFPPLPPPLSCPPHPPLPPVQNLAFRLGETARAKLAKLLLLLLTSSPAAPPLLHLSQSPLREAPAFEVAWRPLLFSLFQAAPHLLEGTTAPPLTSSLNGGLHHLRAGTLELVHCCRAFFPNGGDRSAREIWETLRPDIAQFHSCVSFRAQILLALFLPTRCSPAFYAGVLPAWLELWSGVDNCLEWDLNWLTLLCRARKSLPPDFDWAPYRAAALSRCMPYLYLPMGATGDAHYAARGPPLRGFVASYRVYQRDPGAASTRIIGKLAKVRGRRAAPP